MSRSKHTRPQETIASRRVRLPRESRGSGDRSAARRMGRLLKELGIVDHSLSNPDLPPPVMPRITVQKPREGYFHHITKKDITQLLLFFGERSYYGIREIRLSDAPGTNSEARLFGRLYIPGRILLYAQPTPPWFVSGRPSQEELSLLESAGAVIQISDDGMRCTIDWTYENLRNFFLFDVLLHEIGHHLQQQFRAKRTAQILRTQDHESFARLFASKCRSEFNRSSSADAT